MPEPHRSTIDYHFYTSNGYIIFNPDVRYVDGYPGESCFNCVMPGITSLIAKGYVNEKAIGAQGHSWGGYQVAYLGYPDKPGLPLSNRELRSSICSVPTEESVGDQD